MDLYRIILVDDEEEVRKSIIKKIDWNAAGFQVVGDAENGEEALERIEALEPDVVLTDIRMPYMDGLTLAEKVRQRFPSTKIVIYVTATALYALAGFLLAAKTAGASTNMGQGYELEAIAACTIGGVSVNGGVGKISGVIVGVLVFELLKSTLQFLGVDPNYQYILQGVVIVVAIALDIRKYIVKK